MKTTNHAESVGGKPVINARKRLKVIISAQDVKGGKNKDPGACAAAKALVRTVPGCVAARVHLSRTYILSKKGNWQRYRTPESLYSEIVAFDRGGKFEPGEFILRPLSPSTLIPRRKVEPRPGRESGNKTNVGKTPRKLHVMTGVRPRGANR